MSDEFLFAEQKQTDEKRSATCAPCVPSRANVDDRKFTLAKNIQHFTWNRLIRCQNAHA